VVDIRFCGVLVNMLTTTNPNIYHTLGEHADRYTKKSYIYHTLGEHADQYTTKPNIYHNLCEHADQS
jgi:hypothetical protein